MILNEIMNILDFNENEMLNFLKNIHFEEVEIYESDNN